MIDQVVMRPTLVGVIAGVPHDRDTPYNPGPPTYLGAHPAKTVTFSTPGTYQFRVPAWVRSINRTAFGGGGGGGGATDLGAGGGVGGWCCTDTIETVGGELWTVVVGAGGIAGTTGDGGGGGDSRIDGSSQALLAPGGKGGLFGGEFGAAANSGTSGSVAVGSVIRLGGPCNENSFSTGNGGGSSASPAANGEPGLATDDGSIAGLGGVLAGAGSGGNGGGIAPDTLALPGDAPGGGGGGAKSGTNGAAGGAGRVVLSWDAVE